MIVPTHWINIMLPEDTVRKRAMNNCLFLMPRTVVRGLVSFTHGGRFATLQSFVISLFNWVLFTCPTLSSLFCHWFVLRFWIIVLFLFFLLVCCSLQFTLIFCLMICNPNSAGSLVIARRTE